MAKEDQAHTRFVVGDGKDGYEKGKFYIKVDKDYKSASENFAAVQSIANDRSGTALMFLDATGTKIGSLIGVQEGSKVVAKDANEVLGEDVSTVMGPISENSQPGLTLFPAPANPRVGAGYGKSKYIEVHVWKDQPEVEVVAAQFHELRAHVFLSEMGRNPANGIHPKVDAAANPAEAEVRRNFSKP